MSNISEETLTISSNQEKTQPIKAKFGENNPNWKGGLARDKDHMRELSRGYYHARKRKAAELLCSQIGCDDKWADFLTVTSTGITLKFTTISELKEFYSSGNS